MAKHANQDNIGYLAVFTPAVEGGWVVSFPGLPGCLTQGDTLEEAERMAQDALTLYLETCLADGIPFPDPRDRPGVRGRKARWIEPLPHLTLPLLLRKMRRRQGLTQKDMARKMRMTEASYQRLEYPKNFNTTVKTLERVGRALRLKVHIGLEPIGHQ